MPRGRPPNPGTAEEKAAARRERVRENVRALRERRKKEIALLNDIDEPSQLKIEWLTENGPTQGFEQNNDDDDDDDDDDEEEVEEEDNENDTTLDLTSTQRSRQQTNQASASSGAFFVVNQKNNAVIKFPKSVNTKGPYAAAILGIVRQQFLPDSVYLPPPISKTSGKPWESDQFLWTPCAFWVTSAHTRACAQESSLLKTAVLAIGMLLKSMEHRDALLRIAALEMYRRCLAGIRRVIEPLYRPDAKRPKDTVSIYLSCHAAAMFELVQNSDLSATMHHLRGISSLIRYLGEDVDTDGQSIAWMLLQDYRFAEMGLCLRFRYTSLSSVKRRQLESDNVHNLQLSRRPVTAFGAGNHSMLVTIVDIADEITLVMIQLDRLRLQWTNPNTSLKLKHLLQHLDAVASGYDTLYNQLTARYGNAFVLIDDDSNDIGLGYFRFKTFDIGAAWCYNLMTEIYCIETIIETTMLLLQAKRWTMSMPSPPDSRISADSAEDAIDFEYLDERYLSEKLKDSRKKHRQICIHLARCLQYFLQTDKGITGLSLAIFPLDAASCMLDVEMTRLGNDLREARLAQASSSELNTILSQQTELELAKEVCRNMQLRAESHGLPSFYTTGALTHATEVDPKDVRD